MKKLNPILKIKLAAIKHKTGIYTSDVSHDDIRFKTEAMHGIILDDVNSNCGFVDSNDVFMGRSRAYDIAEKAGQLIKKSYDKILYSDMIKLEG